jgi:hypothetical protein
MSAPIAFEDPGHPGNGPQYHTGKPCIEPGCNRPAGTWWSPIWCFEHNVQRIKGIDGQFEKVRAALAPRKEGEG